MLSLLYYQRVRCHYWTYKKNTLNSKRMINQPFLIYNHGK
jgi:hypothetical protein